MTIRVFTLLCTVPLAACNLMWAGNPGRTDDIGVGIRQPGDTAAPEAPKQVAYMCDGGVSLTVTFDNAGKAIVVRPGAAPATLEQQVSGSGFRYSDGTSELSGKGDEALWTTGGKTLRCAAQAG
jgi:membrane-bound inhibitor of C-type lysozyme